MQVIQSLSDIQNLRHPISAKVGFVPTMGYLHEGHLSLVEAAKKDCDIVIVSIFVNPAQFGPSEDLSIYPRDLDKDLSLLKSLDVDYVFFPTEEMMYPKGYKTWVEVEQLSDILCGSSRPGHFKGVCTVVLKLVNLVKPHYMYMGEKDFQQLSILRIMLSDLNVPTQIISCPIVRESDGLAKSSRNVFLNPEQRLRALCLSQALHLAKEMVASGITDVNLIQDQAIQHIDKAGAKLDYLQVRDSNTLLEQQNVDETSRMFIAAWVGKTRLIDNSLLQS